MVVFVRSKMNTRIPQFRELSQGVLVDILNTIIARLQHRVQMSQLIPRFPISRSGQWGRIYGRYQGLY
jgi:hypothetical protein